METATENDHAGNSLLDVSIALRVFGGTHCACLGLDKVDKAAASIVDGLLNPVIRRLFARFGIGSIRALDGRICFRRRLRAYSEHDRLFAELLALLPLDAAR